MSDFKAKMDQIQFPKF